MSFAPGSPVRGDEVGETTSTWDNSEFTPTWRSAWALLHNKKYVDRTGEKVLPTVVRPAIDSDVRRQLTQDVLHLQPGQARLAG